MSLRRQASMFAFVGAFAFAAHYSVLIGLVEARLAAPVPAALMAFVAGGIVSYILNRRLTFRSERRHRDAAPSFAGVALVGFGLTGLLMWVLVERLGLPYLPAQLAVTGVVLLWTFTANKLWTFRA